MIYASTRQNESGGRKVFVDSSGRRGRILALFGGVAALGALTYIGVVIASVVQAPSAELTTKATVSATASATATAPTASTAASTVSKSAAPVFRDPGPMGPPGGPR
ncbi:hypothetical protein [Actinoplanes sp. L3-i22]|uniref:hypothetical protein n=1 Tax=Actinoplanes sp. L3-i22 TaxID=2836373 RepID=UPI001C858BA1|nr:hypothetical protein [Actinoplanes sp. L3-i22]